ncbi:hypothetical protein GOB33_18955 [Sinorhizobium meliloti]|nr:hypothetical protein [Sinorhizobium meliloti]
MNRIDVNGWRALRPRGSGKSSKQAAIYSSRPPSQRRTPTIDLPQQNNRLFAKCDSPGVRGEPERIYGAAGYHIPLLRLRHDFIILDELGYLPFAQAVEASRIVFHLQPQDLSGNTIR